MEQIVDLPSAGGGLGQGSSSSAGPALFARGKKVRSWVRTHPCSAGRDGGGQGGSEEGAGEQEEA